MTICTLLHYPIKELYVTGFDFYTEKKVYCEGITPSVDAASETLNVGGTHGSACKDAQIMFLKDLHHNFSKLLVDSKIREILDKTGN